MDVKNRIARVAISIAFSRPLIVLAHRGHDVAGRIAMSPPVFSRFFKRTVGRTFVEYLAALRISHACRLLIESELSVVEISLRSGFNNLSNFNRRFLKLKRMSPRQYRTHHQPVRS